LREEKGGRGDAGRWTEEHGGGRTTEGKDGAEEGREEEGGRMTKERMTNEDGTTAA